MSLLISSVFTYDEDAGNYIQAVETADAQALEPATRKAINNFVIGCKQDGIWTAIKASCILAGARTLNGALVPLVGAAPTNNNFVSGDYNRKTGLVGNGSTKYLNSNRNNNADPQDNQHLAVGVSSAGTLKIFEPYIGVFPTGSIGASHFGQNTSALEIGFRSRNSTADVIAGSGVTGFIGMNRAASGSYAGRHSGANLNFSRVSQTPANLSIIVFGRDTVSDQLTNARLAFYSIGESLDLARLDSRVTDLINAFAVTIP